MGSSQNCLCRHRNRHLLLSLLFLLVSCLSTQLRFMAEGRAFEMEEEEDEKTAAPVAAAAMKRSLIGSKPPRCERRCKSCGHCEAVQVPVTTPQRQEAQLGHRSRRHFSQAAYSSRGGGGGGDDISNYKPMSWKCKCGDLFFNP